MNNLIKNPIKKSIQQLSDHTLLDEVKMLVHKEKELVAQVIEYLKEIEIRKLHLARGYSSLFAFATEFLGYSEAEAHIRIQAARLTQALPEVKALIESGDISLSVAATAQNHFRKENQRRKEAGQPSLSLNERREVLDLVMGSSRREAEQSLNIHFAQQSEKRMSFEASAELVEKIERLMDLMAHKNFERDLGKMVEILVDGELARYDKKLTANHVTEKSQVKGLPGVETEITDSIGARKNHNSRSERQRYIPRTTRALVWTKSKGQCTYRDPLTGKKCQATHGLEVDHKLAFSRGGWSENQNLTLLCRAHNSWKAARLVE